MVENKNDIFSYSKYFVPKVEIKDYNAWIDGKFYLDIPILKEKKKLKKLLKSLKTLSAQLVIYWIIIIFRNIII